MEAGDKEWAQKYILDPLTAPEPSEETGPGTSHFSQLRGSLTYTNPASHSGSQSGSHSRHSHRSSSGSQRNSKSKALEEASVASSKSTPGYPTPPGSASPTRNSFHSSNPFSSPRTSVRDAPPPYTPSGEPSSSSRSRHSNQPSISLTPPRSEPRHRSSSTGHLPSPTPRHTRDRSLSQRFPGDMSHRPLDVLKREARAADKPQHRRRRHGGSTDTDIIDSLDTIGGAYHHGGPYDATLASHNLNQTYSPVAAVHDSNMEALRATPREYVQDSLQRHMPLQGTASVPSGTMDMSGKVMEYEEGADLMREADAPGGAYKRWDGIQYHPEDYKGKGEPSYTYERDAKERKHGKEAQRNEIEMQTGLLYPTRRQRSHSNGAAASSGNAFGDDADGLQRSNTTGKRISSGLKKRFGSIRRKKTPQEEGTAA